MVLWNFCKGKDAIFIYTSTDMHIQIGVGSGLSCRALLRSKRLVTWEVLRKRTAFLWRRAPMSLQLERGHFINHIIISISPNIEDLQIWRLRMSELRSLWRSFIPILQLYRHVIEKNYL